MTVLQSWRDGWKRVFAAPAIAAGVFAMTFLLALPLAITLRGQLASHLGSSVAADTAAAGVNYDWWQEFTAQATGLGTTFTPNVIGFAMVLDNVSGVLDARGNILPIVSALGLYLGGWAFLSGGILDRYARQRPLHVFGFFGATRPGIRSCGCVSSTWYCSMKASWASFQFTGRWNERHHSACMSSTIHASSVVAPGSIESRSDGAFRSRLIHAQPPQVSQRTSTREMSSGRRFDSAKVRGRDTKVLAPSRP